MSKEIKNYNMKIKGHTFEKFICPVCNEEYNTYKEAEECLNQKPQIHKHNIGDVIWVYPGYHSGYLIINELSWDLEKHKQVPIYFFEGCFQAFTDNEIQHLHMTKENRERLLRRTESLLSILPESHIDESEIIWSPKDGTYKIQIIVNKDCINDTN